MARSRNPAHRRDLLGAATRVFGEQGLGASAASIAEDAKISTGTLFVYFDTKSALVNELYVDLKSELARIATETDVLGHRLDHRRPHAAPRPRRQPQHPRVRRDVARPRRLTPLTTGHSE